MLPFAVLTKRRLYPWAENIINGTSAQRKSNPKPLKGLLNQAQ
jgi:hypothetical protein